tara:strand:- start:3203 stop:4048 length:846 start_codon:yes stop_codon:yes gene_type:complete
MKKSLTVLTALGLLGTSLPVQAGIEEDIAAFQDYFKKRFPAVSLEDYADGVNALPQYAHRRANWELLMEFPPHDPDLKKGRELWATPFKNGGTFGECFKDKPPANKYPYYDPASDDLITVEEDINSCLKANGEDPIKNLDTGTIALLAAAFREQFNGEKMAVDVSHPEAVKWYEKGRQYYWARRGQLNFSCATCHVHSAGNKLRGDVLSAGLGHGVGFPVYRTKWSIEGNPWGTLHRRYGGCNKQAHANPLEPQSPEYKALELYEAVMNTGIPLKVPSQRE